MRRRLAGDGTGRRPWRAGLAVRLAILPVAAALAAGVVRIPPGSHTLLTRFAPRDITVAELGLREAGLQAAAHFPEADEIRIFADAAATNAAPLARIWINAAQSNAYWFHTGGRGNAERFAIRRGNAVIVVTRASSRGLSVPAP